MINAIKAEYSLSSLLFMDVGHVGSSKFQQSAIHGSRRQESRSKCVPFVRRYQLPVANGPCASQSILS